jgi:RimJ/RimL family protein N-acetyltransferase
MGKVTLLDGAFALQPISKRHWRAMLALASDPEVHRFTGLRVDADEPYIRNWIDRYVQAWKDGSRAAFAIVDSRTADVIGWAAVVNLEREARQAELGYMVAGPARGRGAATHALEMLTRWCFETLELERLELRMDEANVASMRVARHAGYTHEGTLRSAHLKDGRRADIAIWSRLRND